MKPTNPVAQKAALNSPQYKVSPHGLKAKVKPLTGPGSASKAGKKQFNTVKLVFKELLNKEQIGFKELFTDHQLFYTINLLLNKELLPV